MNEAEEKDREEKKEKEGKDGRMGWEKLDGSITTIQCSFKFNIRSKKMDNVKCIIALASV